MISLDSQSKAVFPTSPTSPARKLSDFDVRSLQISGISAADFLDVCKCLEIPVREDFLQSLYNDVHAGQRPSLIDTFQNFRPSADFIVSSELRYSLSGSNAQQTSHLVIQCMVLPNDTRSFLRLSLRSGNAGESPSIEIEYDDNLLRTFLMETDKVSVFDDILAILRLRRIDSFAQIPAGDDTVKLAEGAVLMVGALVPELKSVRSDRMLGLRKDILTAVVGIECEDSRECRIEQIKAQLFGARPCEHKVVPCQNSLKVLWSTIEPLHRCKTLPILQVGNLLIPISRATTLEDAEAAIRNLESIVEAQNTKKSEIDRIVPLSLKLFDLDNSEAASVLAIGGIHVSVRLVSHLRGVIFKGANFDADYLARMETADPGLNFSIIEEATFDTADEAKVSSSVRFEPADKGVPFVQFYDDDRSGTQETDIQDPSLLLPDTGGSFETEELDDEADELPQPYDLGVPVFVPSGTPMLDLTESLTEGDDDEVQRGDFDAKESILEDNASGPFCEKLVREAKGTFLSAELRWRRDISSLASNDAKERQALIDKICLALDNPTLTHVSNTGLSKTSSRKQTSRGRIEMVRYRLPPI